MATNIPDNPYRILIIRCSASGKTNSLSNLINHQPDIDKIYLYTKDQYETKYQILINKRQSAGLLLLNSQMIWMIFIKTLKNTTQIRNVKY